MLEETRENYLLAVIYCHYIRLSYGCLNNNYVVSCQSVLMAEGEKVNEKHDMKLSRIPFPMGRKNRTSKLSYDDHYMTVVTTAHIVFGGYGV